MPARFQALCYLLVTAIILHLPTGGFLHRLFPLPASSVTTTKGKGNHNYRTEVTITHLLGLSLIAMVASSNNNCKTDIVQQLHTLTVTKYIVKADVVHLFPNGARNKYFIWRDTKTQGLQIEKRRMCNGFNDKVVVKDNICYLLYCTFCIYQLHKLSFASDVNGSALQTLHSLLTSAPHS